MVMNPSVNQMNFPKTDNDPSMEGMIKANNTCMTKTDETSASLITAYNRHSILAREFVRQYYTILGDEPKNVHLFYSADSVYVFNGGVPVFGKAMIAKRINEMDLNNCHTKIRAVDADEVLNGMVIQVVGEISFNSAPSRRFVQTFVLAQKTERNYYVHNDMFRYLDDLFTDNVADNDVIALANDVDRVVAVNGVHDDTLNNNQHVVEQTTYVHQPLPQRRACAIGGSLTSGNELNAAPFPEPSTDWNSASSLLPTSTAPVQPVSSLVHCAAPQLSAALHQSVERVESKHVSPVKQQHAIVESPDERPTSAGKESSTGGASNAGDDAGDEMSVSNIEVNATWAKRVAGNPMVNLRPKTLPSASAPVQTTLTTHVLPAAPAPTPTDTQPPQTSSDSPAPSSSSANGGGVAAAGGTGHHRSTFRSGGGCSFGSRGASYDDGDACREIYVRNLPDDITKEELFNVFSKIGEVDRVHVVSRARMPGKPFPSFAFVQFVDVEVAKLSLDQKSFSIRDSHQIYTDFKVDRRMVMDRAGAGDRMNNVPGSNSVGGNGPVVRGGRGNMAGRGCGGYRGGRNSGGGGNATGGGPGGSPSFFYRGSSGGGPRNNGHSTYHNGGGFQSQQQPASAAKS